MKESNIRDNLLRIYSDACDDMQHASSTLKDYCDEHNLSYDDAARGSLKASDDVLLRRYINQFFMANGELEGVRRVLEIFYTDMEIDMIHAGCIKKIQDNIRHRFEDVCDLLKSSLKDRFQEFAEPVPYSFDYLADVFEVKAECVDTVNNALTEAGKDTLDLLPDRCDLIPEVLIGFP